MSAIYGIRVNGFVIDFFSDRGVIVDPRRGYDMTDPEYIKAIRMAAAVWVDFRDFAPYAAQGAIYVRSNRDVPEEFRAYREEFVKWLVEESQAEAVAYQERTKVIEARRAAERAAKVSGFVYLLKKEEGVYKIGKTVNVKNRGTEFSVKLPFATQYECVITTTDRNTLEAELHQKFKAKRINGEWFALSPEDVEYIKGLAV